MSACPSLDQSALLVPSTSSMLSSLSQPRTTSRYRTLLQPRFTKSQDKHHHLTSQYLPLNKNVAHFVEDLHRSPVTSLTSIKCNDLLPTSRHSPPTCYNNHPSFLPADHSQSSRHSSISNSISLPDSDITSSSISSSINTSSIFGSTTFQDRVTPRGLPQPICSSVSSLSFSSMNSPHNTSISDDEEDDDDETDDNDKTYSRDIFTVTATKELGLVLKRSTVNAAHSQKEVKTISPVPLTISMSASKVIEHTRGQGLLQHKLISILGDNQTSPQPPQAPCPSLPKNSLNPPTPSVYVSLLIVFISK